MSEETCGRCKHFRQFPGEMQGLCYGQPPVCFQSGDESRVPKVKVARPCCAFFSAIPEGEKPSVKGKVSCETPGDALKQRREMKRA
jgi:hypothetical protein